jgi:hypothetical protein
MREEPEMSPFMKLVLHEKSPAKATQLIRLQMRKWKGTVSVGALKTVYVQWIPVAEANLSEPGGMTGFMFFPPIGEMASGQQPITATSKRIRDYFDLPAGRGVCGLLH